MLNFVKYKITNDIHLGKLDRNCKPEEKEANKKENDKSAKCDENEVESINIDSLLTAYKQDEKDKDMSTKSDDVQKSNNDIFGKKQIKTGILKLVKFDKSNNEVNEKLNNLDLEETNKHVSFKKQGLDKKKSVTIKNKHQILREDRTSKILAPVLKV